MRIAFSKDELKHVLEALDNYIEDLTHKANVLYNEGENSPELNHYIGFSNRLAQRLNKKHREWKKWET